jgi:hypothetical protein
MAYLKHVGIGATRLLNAVLGGRHTESLSSRAWRHRTLPGWRQLRIAIDAVFLVLLRQRDHCRNAWETDNFVRPPAT